MRILRQCDSAGLIYPDIESAVQKIAAVRDIDMQTDGHICLDSIDYLALVVFTEYFYIFAAVGLSYIHIELHIVFKASVAYDAPCVLARPVISRCLRIWCG